MLCLVDLSKELVVCHQHFGRCHPMTQQSELRVTVAPISCSAARMVRLTKADFLEIPQNLQEPGSTPAWTRDQISHHGFEFR